MVASAGHGTQSLINIRSHYYIKGLCKLLHHGHFEPAIQTYLSTHGQGQSPEANTLSPQIQCSVLLVNLWLLFPCERIRR